MTEDYSDFDEIRRQFEERVMKLGEADTVNRAKSESVDPDNPTETSNLTQNIDSSDADIRSNESKTPGSEAPEQNSSGGETTEQAAPQKVPDDEPHAIPEPPDIAPPIKRHADAYVETERLAPEGRGLHVTSVYKATLEDGEEIVIKSIPKGNTIGLSDSEALLTEAETMERFADANHVVSLLNHGIPETSTRARIVLEYMDGGTLVDRLGELPIEQAVWTAMCITHGVSRAHFETVTHGDLKPQNILFRSTENGWDVPKVGDWGEANMVGNSRDRLALSDAYAAPEQHLFAKEKLADVFGVERKYYDTVNATDTDQYQLGVTLYELLTGVNPFEGHSMGIEEAKFTVEPTPPSDKSEDVPEIVDAPVLKALERRPRDRHTSVWHFLEELAAIYDSLVERDVPADRPKATGWTTGSDSN